jgi:hypothetical protein
MRLRADGTLASAIGAFPATHMCISPLLTAHSRAPAAKGNSDFRSQRGFWQTSGAWRFRTKLDPRNKLFAPSRSITAPALERGYVVAFLQGTPVPAGMKQGGRSPSGRSRRSSSRRAIGTNRPGVVRRIIEIHLVRCVPKKRPISPNTCLVTGAIGSHVYGACDSPS